MAVFQDVLCVKKSRLEEKPKLNWIKWSKIVGIFSFLLFMNLHGVGCLHGCCIHQNTIRELNKSEHLSVVECVASCCWCQRIFPIINNRLSWIEILQFSSSLIISPPLHWILTKGFLRVLSLSQRFKQLFYSYQKSLTFEYVCTLRVLTGYFALLWKLCKIDIGQ